VNCDFVFAAVADERRQIASLIDELDEAQLATPSLCAGWDIKTVAAHLVSVITDSFWTFQRTALRRGGVDRAIDELARRRARLSSAEIASTLHRYADHELSPAAHRASFGTHRRSGAQRRYQDPARSALRPGP
jgi:uncharacterized protein (TIGR03083 family)